MREAVRLNANAASQGLEVPGNQGAPSGRRMEVLYLKYGVMMELMPINTKTARLSRRKARSGMIRLR
jgi:hypothetical protein